MIFEINTQLARPIYEQLRDQVVLGIASKQLAPNEGLPSVRQLASDLGINLHTVNKTYTILCGEGYIVMDRRKGATVAPIAPNNEDFINTLSHSLTLSAAEARCRAIGEDAFVTLCRNCYQSIGNGGENNG